MPYFHKFGWKNVHQESAHKFNGRNRHGFPLVAVLVIAPLERNAAVFHFNDTIIGNGNAMGIPPQIFNNRSGSLKRRFTIDNPLFAVTGIEQAMKAIKIVQMLMFPEKHEFCRFEVIEKFAPELTG
jgi:hypothetical protein